MNLLKQLSLKSKCKTRDLQNIEENHWTIKMLIKERLLWPEKKDTINENTKMLRNNRKDTKIFLYLIGKGLQIEKHLHLHLSEQFKPEIRWMQVSKANQIRLSSLKRKTPQNTFQQDLRSKMKLDLILMHHNNLKRFILDKDKQTLIIIKKNNSTLILILESQHLTLLLKHPVLLSREKLILRIQCDEHKELTRSILFRRKSHQFMRFSIGLKQTIGSF